MFWFREDQQISEDARTTVKVTPTDKKTFKVVLELNDVVEADAGLYKIRAKNKYGEVAASINLNFSRESTLCIELLILMSELKYQAFPLVLCASFTTFF